VVKLHLESGSSRLTCLLRSPPLLKARETGANEHADHTGHDLSPKHG
jgi:hypothetical protein